MSSLRPFFPLIVFAGLLVGFAVALTRGDPRILESNLINEPFPAFELTILDDPDISVTEIDLKGQISLVNVFGSWCIACVQEHPNLVAIGKTDRIQLVGMNWRDARDKGRRWLNKYGDPYDVIIFDEDSELAVALGVTGAPETYLVDRAGHIRYKHVGIITFDVWNKTLLPMITALESEA